MTESQDCVYAHNAMRDCFKQDMVNDRLSLRKYNHRVFLRKHNHGIRKRKAYSRLHF